MTVRVDVAPELLLWACDRRGVAAEDLEGRFPKIGAWLAGEVQPTLKQLEAFARATHTPVGYLFLPEPPVEEVPIPDLRTMRDRAVERPSPDLLDTLYLCQQRQEWYRDFARANREDRREFIGSATVDDDVVDTAARIREVLGFDLEARRQCKTWTDALRQFIEQADRIGVLLMVSSIVGSNTHRKLDPEEFRGFALSDEYAPLVFINGADTKAAQMFTLAHELAHLWLGETALSDVGPLSSPRGRIESWCNRVGAELLVPLAVLRAVVRRDEDLDAAKQRLARRFKVSTLVILRRLRDAGTLTRDELRVAYQHELERLLTISRKKRGGDFYLTLPVRLSKRFARALVVSTQEGQTLYREAFRLLGIAKLSTFEEVGRKLGVA